MRRPSGVQTGSRSSPGSKVNCVSVSRAHSYTQMSLCLPSEMSSASFWPSGENRGFAQSAFVARSTDVLPSRVSQSIEFALVAATPGTYTSVPSEEKASCAPPVTRIRERRLRAPARPGRSSRGDRDRSAPRRACPAAGRSDARSARTGRSGRRGRQSSAFHPTAARRRGWQRPQSHSRRAARCRARPFRRGSACGHRCVDRALRLSAPNAAGVPPAAETRMSVALIGLSA